MVKDNYCYASDFSRVLVVTGGSKGNRSAANNQNKLLRILSELFDRIDLITFCDEGQRYLIPKDRIRYLKAHSNRLLNFLFNQFSEVKAIHKKISNANIDLVLFSMGQDLNIIPIVYAKLIGKRVVLRSSGRPTRILSNYIGDKYRIKTIIFKIIEEINYRIVDRILTECEYAIKENDFEKYNKAYSANLFVDTDLFSNRKSYCEREFDIGYIGRFSEEKGITNFLKSISLVLHNRPDLSIFLAGDGKLKDDIVNQIEEMNLQHNVTLHPWIPHENLSDYLNNIKILVIPSTREGLPNMALEAMASGTAVLAASVGSIPGIVVNDETGFIIGDNRPDSIAKGIIHAMNYPDFDKVVLNANLLVNETYSFHKTVEQFRKVLCYQ